MVLVLYFVGNHWKQFTNSSLNIHIGANSTKIMLKKARKQRMGFSVLWILLVAVISAEINLPSHCTYDGSKLECYHMMPTFMPKSATEVIVHETSLDKRFNFSDPGWKHLTHLSINPAVSDSSQGSEFRKLYNDEFISLKNLWYLQISCKCLRWIEENSFRGLDRLHILDLSNNGFLKPSDIAKGLHILPNLTELYLSNTSNLEMEKLQITTDFYKSIINKSLKILDVSNNDYIKFTSDDDDLKDIAFEYLEVLNISNTGLALASLNPVFYKLRELSVTSFKRLKVLDVSYPSFTVPFTTASLAGYFNSPAVTTINSIYFPSTLTEVYAKRTFYSKRTSTAPTKLYGESNSTHLCFRLPPLQNDQKSYFCFIGEATVTLKKLDFSENEIVYIEQNLLHGFKHLSYLDISKNLFGQSFSNDSYALSFFNVFNNLETLFLSQNNITVLPYDIFNSSTFLRRLDLSKNKLETITFNTNPLVSLEYLDLRYNNFASLDAASIQRLNMLLTYESRNISPTKQVDIKIKFNPFYCSCETVNFLKWLITLNETYTCTLNSERKQIDKLSIQRAEYLCIKNIVITSSSVLSLILLVLIIIAIYVIIRRRRLLHMRREIEIAKQLYAHYESNRGNPPVFLSFCSADEEIVLNEIFPNLNAGLKKILNTEVRCVATGGHDFRPGFSVGNEIIRCVEASSVVVYFVTNNFCRKMWCRSEALVAHCDNKPIILMLWEKVNIKLMPKHMSKFYQEYVRVHWVKENGQRVMQPGWDELCQAIVRLFGENAV